MPRVVMEQDGSLRLPEEFMRRRRLPLDVEWWLDQREEAVLLLPRLPDLRKLYVEPTTVCNLHCRTCIRNVWEDPRTHMEMATFRQLVERTREFPGLQRVVLSGFGEPLTYPGSMPAIGLSRLTAG